MKAEDFDKKFDNNEEIMDNLDLSKFRPGHETKRINVDFPVWMISSLDKEARKLGITRQAVIKFWIAEKLGY
ncbi:MAG: CopG family transcriptional regulator [Ignavibacteria bacterium]|jgi:hypothetical protein